MGWNTLKLLYAVLIVICTHSVRGEYVEGIDTTDANGYGLDSAFCVGNGGYVGRTYQYVNYCFHPEASTGYYNYTFNEITKAPDTVLMPGGEARLGASSKSYSLIFKKDSIYSKVQFLRQLSDGRSVYCYGTNTSPNDRRLVNPDYDRSVRYNVNNLYNHQPYCVTGNPSCDHNETDTLYWEPPLPNNNDLLGYILYASKSAAVIDTAKPINPAQWDSIAFFTSTSTKAGCRKFPHDGYFNMVTVYNEGKSGFLGGWTSVAESRTDAKKLPLQSGSASTAITIRNTETDFLVEFIGPTDYAGAPILDLYTVAGRRIASWSIGGTSTMQRIPKRLLPSATFIVRVMASMGTVYTIPVSSVR